MHAVVSRKKESIKIVGKVRAAVNQRDITDD